MPRTGLILFQTEDGRTRIQCRCKNETVAVGNGFVALAITRKREPRRRAWPQPSFA